MSTDGKWLASTNEEEWNDGNEHATREEALEYALSELAPDSGLEDGDCVRIPAPASGNCGNIWINGTTTNEGVQCTMQ